MAASQLEASRPLPVMVQDVREIPPAATRHVVAHCQPGSVALSGGYHVALDSDIEIKASRPTRGGKAMQELETPSSWTLRVENRDRWRSGFVTAYVLCGRSH